MVVGVLSRSRNVTCFIALVKSVEEMLVTVENMATKTRAEDNAIL